MALVGYDSSDEDEEVQTSSAPKPIDTAKGATAITDGNLPSAAEPKPEPVPATEVLAPVEAGLAAPLPESTNIIGPMRPPEGASNIAFPPLEEAPMEDEPAALSLPPGSPYSANRALLRDLTLPAVPSMEIPPSPPGSPLPGTNKKFEQFLELKKKGIHFNSKIAQSSALKNPSLMDKLMSFSELDQKDQYSSTLGTDLWNPGEFPKSAYREQLRQSQTEVGHAKARSKGGAVQFVTASGPSSRDTTPGIAQAPAPSTGKRKTRFDN